MQKNDSSHLDFLVDPSRSVDKGLLDVVGRLGARLQKDQAVLPSELLALLKADRALALSGYTIFKTLFGRIDKNLNFTLGTFLSSFHILCQKTRGQKKDTDAYGSCVDSPLDRSCSR